MPRKTMEVEVNLKVFRWLRESSGWTTEEISKRLKTSVESIKEIESGKKKPTLRQLKELSLAFKRPLAAFLLSEPKKEKPKPKDYRMLPNRIGIFDKKTIFVLRKARSLQEISRELSHNIRYKTKAKVEKIKISDEPETIAERYRGLFKLTEEKQRKFKNPYEFFNYLRDLFEEINILVFQFSMPVEDARGFVFVDESPNIIVVNTKDCIEARLFSLMHEFAHILLGESAIDIPNLLLIDKNEVETWCNEFSSSFLLPKNIAIPLFKSKSATLTYGKTLNALSRKYKVSKAMLSYNMFKLNYITKTEYKNFLERYVPEEILIEKKEAKKGGGGVSPDKICLSKVGNKFVSLVANNYDGEHITYTDALNYLSIKSKNFDKVLAKAKK